jgi:hypothetical protein
MYVHVSDYHGPDVFVGSFILSKHFASSNPLILCVGENPLRAENINKWLLNQSHKISTQDFNIKYMYQG